MKSSFELAMARFGGGELRRLTPEQKEQLAEVDRRIDAKIAQAKIRTEAEQKATMITDKPIKIGAKVGEKGKIFGSVNTIMLADALRLLGVEVDRKYIKLKGEAIKTIGKYEAEVTFHRDVVRNIPFEVVEE